jgi:hypothetical protein
MLSFVPPLFQSWDFVSFCPFVQYISRIHAISLKDNEDGRIVYMLNMAVQETKHPQVRQSSWDILSPPRPAREVVFAD